MKISQIVFNVDEKPVKKAIEKIDYLYKKIGEYNELVIKVNENIEKYLNLKKKADLVKKNEKN